MEILKHSLHPLFNPRTIAVVGASSDPEKIGFLMMRHLLEGGFKGRLYPINPKGGEVFEIPAFPSILKIPDPIDLAILVIPRNAIIPTVKECLEKDVKAAVALTAGFREIGEEGDRVQDELGLLLRGSRLRLLGPNCAGHLNNWSDLNASIELRPPKGHISLVSQSGSLMSAFASNIGMRGLGVAKSTSIGNKVNNSEADLLEYLADDEETQVISFYLEDLREGRRFLKIARSVSTKKPIVVLKAGRTKEGIRATFSHTGAMAGEDRILDGAFRQAGILRAETLDDFYDLCYGLSLSRPIYGNAIGILSDAGGPGVIATDAAVFQGFRIEAPSREAQKDLRSFLPPISSVMNPIDMTFTREVTWYRRSLEILSREPWHSFLVTIPSHFKVKRELAETLIEGSRKIPQPLFVAWLSPWEIQETLRYLTEHKVPVYPTPERALRVMEKLVQYGRWLRGPQRSKGSVRGVSKNNPISGYWVNRKG